MKHMAQRWQRRWPWLVVCCVLLLGVFVWVFGNDITVRQDVASLVPMADDVIVDDRHELSDASGTSEQPASPGSAASGVSGPVPIEETEAGEYETTYTAPASDTIEPGAPAAQAFSPEADAAVAEAGTDADLPRHVEGEVLLTVPNGTTLAELEEMLGGVDFVSLEDTSESDLAMGFVTLSLAEGISVTEASTRLQYVDGINYAEPNFVLTLADDIANPAAFARILDPMTTLQAAAAIGDELRQDLVAATTQGENGAVSAEDGEDPTEPVLTSEVAQPNNGVGAEYEDIQSADEPSAVEAQVDEHDADLAEMVDPTIDGIEALSADLVAAAEPEVRPNDTYSKDGTQWALSSINAYAAWALARCEGNVGIAVIDTGARVGHEDLSSNIIQDYYNSETRFTGSSAVEDTNGHGTHVAGIACAVANNGLGVTGVSYNAKLLVIKASQGSSDSFTADSVIRAFSWILSKPSGSSQTRAEASNIRVINLSVAVNDTKGYLDDPNDALLAKIKEVHDAGILTVCAAGNQASNGAYACYPGDYDYALSVINLERQSDDSSIVRRASGSNYNVEGSDAKDISAPGTDIYSTAMKGSYEKKSGTSMASPCVAGVAALMFSLDSSLTPSAVMSYLQSTATTENITAYNQREFGAGEVDAYAAVDVVARYHISGTSTLLVGESTTLSVKYGLAAASGNWTWASSDTTVANITPSGKLNALRPGTTTITTEGVVDGDAMSCSLLVTVGAINLSTTTVTLAQAEYVYDGKAKTPAVTVKLGSATLKQGTDYTVAYANNKAAGTASITITGKGNYTGTVKKSFSIVTCSISGNSTAYVGLPVKLAASPSRSWTWSSSNASVAAVSSAGVVTPYKVGTVTITARSGSLSCTKTITIASSAFFVYNVNSGLALDVKGASTASGANVQQYAGNRSRAQRWRLEYVKGHFVVRNVGSGMVLDVRGGSKQSGANVQQYKYNGSNAQLWDAVLRSDGTYELVNYGSEMALDVLGGSKKNSANVQQYRRNSSNAQGWCFTPIARTVADGAYRISSAVNTGFVIDLKGGSSANGAAVQLYKWNASAAQKWKLTFDVPTGYYRITSAKTGRAIDVPGARNANGVKLQQYTSNGSWAQLWDVRQNNDGTCTLVSALGGRVIDLPSSRATNGNRLQTWTSNSSKAQRWRLTKM